MIQWPLKIYIHTLLKSKILSDKKRKIREMIKFHFLFYQQEKLNI